MLATGSAYLQQFCAGAVNAVVSPFVLYDLAMEAAHVMARNNPVHVSNQLRSNILNPLFQKCLQMWVVLNVLTLVFLLLLEKGLVL